MLEKILTCKCCHRITRMKEEGISNIYIDDLMKKISCSFRGTFSIDKIPTFKDEKFSIIVNLSKENEKGRILLEYRLRRIQLYILIHTELNILI